MKLKGFPSRIMGLETEYGALAEVYSDKPYEPGSYLLRELGRTDERTWFSNGGCFYLDVGHHPEFCTPECLTGYEAAIHERVGEAILSRAAERLEARSGHTDRFWLFKNNVSENRKKFGCHENYLAPRELSIGRITDQLAAYFVTRSIWMGSGIVLGDPEDETAYRYEITQGAAYIWETTGEQSTKERAIVDTRDQPLADPERFRRLHIILGDSSVLFAPAAMKLEITALLLLMLENNALYSMRLISPVASLHRVSRDWQAELETYTGMRTAVQIQQSYLNQAARFVERYRLRQYDVALAWWGRTLRALADARLGELVGQVDWVTKLDLINRQAARRGNSYIRARRLDLEYHTLYGGSGLMHRLRRKHEPPELAGKVRAAAKRPPATRAQLRQRLAEATRLAGLQPYPYWNAFQVRDEFRRDFLPMMDPFTLTSPKAEAFLSRLP